MTNNCDLLIVGGGPAGLAAAINGASEGLKVCLLDAGTALGGQAKESSLIENYPLPFGNAEGVSGKDLMGGFVQQALKFNTNMFCPTSAASLATDANGTKVVTTDDYTEYAAKAVILSIGLSYRKHDAQGLAALMGRGVFYGMPSNPSAYANKTIGIVGGANSAGQAAVRLAKNKGSKVKLLVRGKIDSQMSRYLIDRIRETPNIEVHEDTTVMAVEGDSTLRKCVLVTETSPRGKSSGFYVSMDALFIFIGAIPRTLWLNNTVMMDAKRFIKTDIDVVAAGPNGGMFPFETSVEGVFACGDVRSGSTKRIAAAIGEGSGALQSVHRYLSR